MPLPLLTPHSALTFAFSWPVHQTNFQTVKVESTSTLLFANTPVSVAT
jgi:hypothetical protein